MSQGMHKTTIMIPAEQRDYIENFCFEHGISFAAWVRQQIAQQRRHEQARQQAASSQGVIGAAAPILGRMMHPQPPAL